MTQPTSATSAAQRPGPTQDLPSPDIVDFIRYCHRQRGAAWPELYDEMCGVAARREFHGWDHAQLAERGVTFSLLEMPRLAGWARAVVATMPGPDIDRGHTPSAPHHGVKAAVA
jgi:hypothetical protein